MLAQEDTLTEAPSPTGSVKLSGDVMAVKVIADDTGAERTELVKPDLIVPGDRLVFGTDYANEGSEAVSDFVVTNPLPSAVRLASDADAGLTVSVDDGTSWGTLSSLSVTEDDGSVRSATHADVTHVRWTIASIAPGASGRLEYPAIIR
ncbi:hypothetical protein [Qipengyuania seohaensis]|uniref:hypothetical protein n=1 Tax=Qipengyuania seohaensis TaxID=266951 RepID=UPI001E407985|nr:hypothetical protein [Qipengyuania seohaensis]